MMTFSLRSMSLVTGVVLSATLATPGLAQSAKKPGFVFAELQVTDPAGFQAYAAKVPPTLAPFHGRYTVRGKPDIKEGEASSAVMVVLAFDSLADAEGWYNSPAYQVLIPERQKSAKTRVMIIEGLPE